MVGFDAVVVGEAHFVPGAGMADDLTQIRPKFRHPQGSLALYLVASDTSILVGQMPVKSRKRSRTS